MGSNFWCYKILYRERIFQNTEESKQNILHICRGLFTLFQISRFRDVMCQQTAQLEPHRTPAYLFNHQHSPICSLELGGFVIFVINNLQNTEKANYDVLHCFCIWLSMFLNATIGLVPHNFLVCDGPTLEKFFLPSWMESRSLERWCIGFWVIIASLDSWKWYLMCVVKAWTKDQVFVMPADCAIQPYIWLVVLILFVLVAQSQLSL